MTNSSFAFWELPKKKNCFFFNVLTALGESVDMEPVETEG